MNFLNPWYAIAALAIAFPILFHLIRRQPKGNQPFSSLMFLDASPPRLTRRSRIDHWLLLLLRIAAILFVAFAFTRPFWNSNTLQEITPIAKRTLILLDTSASMRREGVWEKALQEVARIRQQASPQDAIALYAFDREVHSLVSFEDASGTPAKSQERWQAALEKTKPRWYPTDLGLALVTASDILRAEDFEDTGPDEKEADANDQATRDATTAKEIIVVTDYCLGSSTERLASYQWPSHCPVQIARVDAPAGNVRWHLLQPNQVAQRSGDASAETPPVHVRLINQPDAHKETFQLEWCDAAGKGIADTLVNTRVPPGATLTIPMAPPPPQATLLRLNGDTANFDDTFYLIPKVISHFQLPCIAPEQQPTAESLGYFPAKIPLHDLGRQVQFVLRAPDHQEPLPPVDVAPLVIAGSHCTLSDAKQLHQHLQQGGHVLWVLDQAVSESNVEADWHPRLQALLGATESLPELREATPSQEAIIEWVDFTHPLFLPLADPRFNDFAKVHFWKHRKLTSLTEDWQTLARFDNGDPLLLQRAIGAGRLTILTSGWQPVESQLALSSKFVPILWGLFQASLPTQSAETLWEVGDHLEIANAEDTWQAPDGTSLQPMNETGKARIVFEQPGIYRGVLQGKRVELAVNLDPKESEVQVADLDLLERMGIPLGSEVAPARQVTAQRELQAVELEADQSWWRWILMAVVVAIALETLFGLWRGSSDVGYATGK